MAQTQNQSLLIASFFYNLPAVLGIFGTVEPRYTEVGYNKTLL